MCCRSSGGGAKEVSLLVAPLPLPPPTAVLRSPTDELPSAAGTRSGCAPLQKHTRHGKSARAGHDEGPGCEIQLREVLGGFATRSLLARRPACARKLRAEALRRGELLPACFRRSQHLLNTMPFLFFRWATAAFAVARWERHFLRFLFGASLLLVCWAYD